MGDYLSFMEAVAYIDDYPDDFVFSPKGLDKLTDLFEHLYHGGSIVDNPSFDITDCQVVLATAWATIRNSVIQYDEM